jgi:hypothetical protein
LTGEEESPLLSLASEIFASLIARWPSRFDSLIRAAEFDGRESTVGADDPLPWVMPLELEPVPVDDELVWLLEELGVLNEEALLWLLTLELVDDELVETLGAGLLCVVLNDEEDDELEELLGEGEDELLVLAVVECCAKSAVETSVRLATIRINRRMMIPPAT